MPGNIDIVHGGFAHGWARHPIHPAYPLTIHTIQGGIVTATTLADIAREDGMPGFAVAVAPGADPARLRVLIGETDETLRLPGLTPSRRRILTVEDLVATPTKRAWVTGATHIDGAAAGLLPETIIDLLCRDHLGRPAGPVITATALDRLAGEGFEATRRLLIDSGEYRHRRVHADRAAGAIFSQQLVMAAAGRDFTTAAQRDAKVIYVQAAPLLELDGENFITACYLQILRKEPDRGGMLHYLAVLAARPDKGAVIRHLASEFEAISAGIVVTGLPPAVGA